MLLVGMLDSPYVRRVAIAGTILGVPFEHRSVSVFRHMDRFREINPLVKAPSLVADDGSVLMESQLVLQHLEDVAGRSLRPREQATRIADLRATGLALVLMEKAIAIEYERKRPAESQHQPWIDRVEAQLATALGALEGIAIRDWRALPAQQTHGSIGAAVAWGFIRFVVPDTMEPDDYPALRDHAARCEETRPFVSWPVDRTAP